MPNYIHEWRNGYLSDEPLTNFEKLKKSVKKNSNEKELTLQRQKERRSKNETDA